MSKLVFSKQARAKFGKYFVRFLDNGVSRKNAFDIYLPLASNNGKGGKTHRIATLKESFDFVLLHL